MSHKSSIPSDAAAAVYPSSLVLNTQSSEASELRINRSDPNPALTKALTYVIAKFFLAESTPAAPNLNLLSSKCVLKI